MKNLQKYTNKKFKKGISLLELIVVIIISGALAAVVVPDFFKANENTNKTRELSNIDSIQKSIGVVKLSNNGNIYDITATGAGAKILENLTSIPNDLTYFVASNYIGQNSSTNLVAFATTDEARTILKESAEKLDLKYDGATSNGTNGNFRYSLTCDSGVTDGSDCYYQYKLASSGTLPAWETTIGAGATELNASSTTSTATGQNTWVKLVK